MHLLSFLYPTLLASSALFAGGEALRSDSSKKIKLSNVQSLTLRKGLKTSHRRVSAIPQLKCIGGSGRGLYEVDVMRCKNSGADYNPEDIQWTCAASLPPEFKLGSTDVICEGYDSPDDPYILKGSCGVEYRLLLTEAGEKKYGHKKGWFGGDDGNGREPATTGERISAAIFWVIFIGVLIVILWSAFSGWLNRPVVDGAPRRPGWGGGGGGGGGGWWPGGGNDDPPPPYDWRPSSGPKWSSSTQNQQPGGFRPGFWSGALGGAAAGYMAGRTGRRDNSTGQNTGFFGGGRSNTNYGSSWDNGEGGSRSNSGSSSGSSARYESTGFGSTSRR